MPRSALKRPQASRARGPGLRQALAPFLALWPALAVVILALGLGAAAIGLGVPALPVVILFADLLAFLHLRLVMAERRREAASEQASFRLAALELASVKEPHRARLTPAQIPLPFNQWVAEVRAGRHS